MTIENAESFFALDVLSWLFLAILLAIAIVLIDLLFFSKTSPESDVKVAEDRSTFRKICYFLIFLKFSTEVTPDMQAKEYGENLWEQNPDSCCNIRKVIPLKAALKNYDIWITGIRKKQTQVRKQSDLIELESRFEVIKINPLIEWTHDEIWDYIKANNLPYNTLHDKDYPSIGCKQCTSPVCSGEDDRSGRWKGTNKTECGLHQSDNISINT